MFGRDSPCPPVSFLKTSGGIFHDLMIHHIDQGPHFHTLVQLILDEFRSDTKLSIEVLPCLRELVQAQWCMGSEVVEVVGRVQTWAPELAAAEPPVLEETAAVILRFRNGGGQIS